MKRIITFIFFAVISLNAQATVTKQIIIKNTTLKPVYYGVFLNYQLIIDPAIFEPKALNAWKKDIINVTMEQDEGVMEIVVLENNGPLEELQKNGNVLPVCELSIKMQTDSTSYPLSFTDLNNFHGSLRCQVDPDLRSMSIISY